MKTLNNTHIGQIYYIHKVIGKNQSKLRDLGLISDKKLHLFLLMVKIQSSKLTRCV